MTFLRNRVTLTSDFKAPTWLYVHHVTLLPGPQPTTVYHLFLHDLQPFAGYFTTPVVKHYQYGAV